MNTVSTKLKLSTNWIAVEEQSDRSIEIIKEYSVGQIKADGYRLSNQVKMNSNGTPYLLCIDVAENKKAALYMFKVFAANVTENQMLKASEVAVYHVTSKDDDGNDVDGLIIGSPDYKGGISFF